MSGVSIDAPDWFTTVQPVGGGFGVAGVIINRATTPFGLPMAPFVDMTQAYTGGSPDDFYALITAVPLLYTAGQAIVGSIIANLFALPYAMPPGSVEVGIFVTDLAAGQTLQASWFGDTTSATYDDTFNPSWEAAPLTFLGGSGTPTFPSLVLVMHRS